MIDAPTIKVATSPADFYHAELPGTDQPRDQGWGDVGLCVFLHDRRSGSFKVNISTGAFHCFSCGASGGNLICFVKLRNNLSFRKALKILAEQYGFSYEMRDKNRVRFIVAYSERLEGSGI